MGGTWGVAREYDIDLFEAFQHVEQSLPEGIPDNQIEVEIHEEFYRSLKEKYQDWMDKYYSFEYPLRLYRCVTLHKNVESIQEFPNTGVYWTDREENAECHRGDFSKSMIPYTLACEVTVDDIDWERTLWSNMHYSIGDLEQEITLKPNRRIHLVGIQGEGPWEQVSYWVKT